MTPDEAQAFVYEGHAELARRSLLRFTCYNYLGYRPNWHHAVLAEHLDRVLSGEIKRLMVFMPPQHGKSELVSRQFPAYALGRNPDLSIISGSYSAELAKEMSGHVQRIIDSQEYGALFPNTRLATEKDIEVRQGLRFGVPGYRGQYFAIGVGGGVTGRTLDIGIIDDPVKSREEAESEAYRKAVWNWYVNDIRTRRRDDSSRFVLTMTRWHEDDLAGRLLRSMRENPLADQWHVVSLPAICTSLQPGDPRQLDEALWPWRFSRKDLDGTRATTGAYAWSALYQQAPVPPGGAMARREWFKLTPVRRSGVLRRVRCWDIAGTKETGTNDPDWTVGTLLAQHADGTWTVEHVVRMRGTPGEVDKLMLQTARLDGSRTLIREERVGLAGKVIEASHVKLFAGYDYAAVSIGGQGDKATRWRPFLIQAEAGNVYLVEGAWNGEWLDEMSLVPYGLHDDQADSVALGYNELLGVKDYGGSISSILPATRTASGPRPGEWQEAYFRR